MSTAATIRISNQIPAIPVGITILPVIVTGPA
jgi:hypothetical protein